ncbi:SAM-dependent methyltransferase [Streptomyces sp. TE33382]
MPPASSILEPRQARMNDYALGGHDHLPADRNTVRDLLNAAPWYESSIQIAHHHTLRTAALLAGELGIRQFLDLGGSGLSLRPGCSGAYPRICSVLQNVTVVHIDTGTSEAGARRCTANPPQPHHPCVHADITQPLPLLRNLVIQGFIDLARPVGVLMADALSWMPDDAGAVHVMERLRAWAPAGSAIALTHATDDLTPLSEAAAVAECLRAAGLTHRPRTREQIAQLLAGWHLREPGLVATGRYHRDDSAALLPDSLSAAYAAIALHPESS